MPVYDLPEQTLINRQIPKKTIFQKFALTARQRNRMDADISRIDIVGILSPRTVPSISPSQTIQSIYIVRISLKRRTYDKNSLDLLAHHIPQRMIFALQYRGGTQLAVRHQQIWMTSPWLPTDSTSLPFSKFQFDAIWEQLVLHIGGLTPTEGYTLSEQVDHKQRQDKINKQITLLRQRMDKEKQLSKQLELWEKIKTLQIELQGSI